MINKFSHRHHNSKHYKNPMKDRLNETVKIDSENPDMELVEVLCSDFWNIWTENQIKGIVDNVLSFNTKEEIREYLKKTYYELGKFSRDFIKQVPRILFNLVFEYGSEPYFSKWLNEIERDKKQAIKGMLEIDILNVFGKREKVKVNEIFLRLKDYNEPTIKSVISKLVEKEAIEKLPLTEYNEQYYKLIAKYDDIGWFIP